MYVRVCSNVSGQIYQSMVYAKVNTGWYEQYIVYNQSNSSFELVEYLDKTSRPAKALVNVIQTSMDGFKGYTGDALLKLQNDCKNSGRAIPDVSFLVGYPDICENDAFLLDILTHRTVPGDRYDLQRRDLPDAAEWHYIRTQTDADAFMDLFAGFHDSTLERIHYTEDETGKKETTAIFDNAVWFGIAELCFEGTQLLKIVPAGENLSRELSQATLLVDDSGVFWADDYLEKPDLSYAGSIIQSLCLKWRKI